MNVICQNKNCNKKWTNIILLELKSTTFSLFLCEDHVSNLEHELLPKWLKTCEKLRKNKFKKEIKMQNSKEIIKNVQSEVEQQQEKINSNIKKWIKRNFQKIALSIAVITGLTGLILGAVAYHKTSELTYYLDHDYKAQWGSKYMRA